MTDAASQGSRWSGLARQVAHGSSCQHAACLVLARRGRLVSACPGMADIGWACHGLVGLDLAWQLRLGVSSSRVVGRSAARQVCLGSLCRGMSRMGARSHGSAGEARTAKVCLGLLGQGTAAAVRCDSASSGTPSSGAAGVACQGQASSGQPRCAPVGSGTAGKARHEALTSGVPSNGPARHGSNGVTGLAFVALGTASQQSLGVDRLGMSPRGSACHRRFSNSKRPVDLARPRVA